MPRIKFNDGQEIIYQDLNNIAAAIEKELLERVAYELGCRQENFCFSDSFLVSYVSSTSVSVAAGIGMQTDSSQTDPESKKRLLYLASAATKSLSAADPSNPRIDIVCIKANRATIGTDSRNFKDVDDTLSVVSFDVETDWASDVLVVTGTPAGSPSAPATPAGYIKIATLAVAAATGLPASGGITDNRTVFLPGSSRMAYVTKTAAYTATPMDEMIFGNTASGSFSVTLPPAANCPGKILRIMQISATNNLTVDGNASETINGELTQVLDQQYSTLTILSNGTGWVIL